MVYSTRLGSEAYVFLREIIGLASEAQQTKKCTRHSALERRRAVRESLTRGAVVALVALVLALRDAVAHVVHGDALPARAPELESAALPRRCKSGNHLNSNNSERAAQV